MKLIGMLDSPYVRRCFVSMRLMGVPFEHESLSVFRTYDQFRKINPVVKAPTLVCDDGTVLMDSTLILDYIEGRVIPGRRLMPAEGNARREALRLHGLALAACEKCVQIVYEFGQRPEEKRHAPWLSRVTEQANAGFSELERTAAALRTPWFQGETLTASDVVVAVSWRFAQFRNAKEVPEALYPALAAHSQRAEALPEFVAAPLS